MTRSAFVILVFILVSSCNDRKSCTLQELRTFIENSDTIKAEILKFQKKYIFRNDDVLGIVAIKPFSVCDIHFMELWRINHESSIINDSSVTYFNLRNNPVLIFNESFLVDTIPDTKIMGLVKKYGVKSIDEPPRSEYTPRVLLRIDNMKAFDLFENMNQSNDSDVYLLKAAHFLELESCL